MIAALRGTVTRWDEATSTAWIEVHGVSYEVRIPVFAAEWLASVVGQADTQIFTYYHVSERNPQPLLVGFQHLPEREFFRKFIEVPDVGPVKAMHAAVQAGLVEATQNVTAAFASLGNNLGPRFELLVRYKDSQNYYLCYRQTGGSSSLRISKVVNGTEAILKQVPVKNPNIGEFFTLGCQVQEGTPGTATLTLTFNGTTVKASDPYSTFSSGSVGFGMGYPSGTGSGSAASQRADNFSATVQ